MSFKSLDLAAPLQKALEEEGYTTPTPIQSRAIPAALSGSDLLGSAQTGTGKTAAFTLPILQKLTEKPSETSGRRPIRSLVITPTRELAIQVADSVRRYGRYTSLKCSVILGGVNQKRQVKELRAGVDILVATPGRLLDLMNQGHISLSDVELFVLDEADRMLDMGFIHDIRKIMKDLPKKRQTLFFSATMPQAIVKLSREILHNPSRIEIAPESPTLDAISQHLYHVNKTTKKTLLVDILRNEVTGSALVFTRTKRGANRVVKMLNGKDIAAQAIHGNKSQSARQRALSNFRRQHTRILVATDIAARGIDVEELEYVINYDLPNEPETYVHRIGRTGRAGSDGTALSFCDAEERKYLRDIEKLTGQRIPVTSHDDSPNPSQRTKMDAPNASKRPEARKRKRPARHSRPTRGKKRSTQLNTYRS